MKISKSKQELARIINESGGWRDRAEWAAQDKRSWGVDNRIVFYTSKPERPLRGGKFWPGDDIGCSHSIKHTSLLPSWHQTALSRAEYFRLYPTPDVDGWIEWRGGECPVDEYCMVDYRMSATPYGYHLTNQARNLAWDGVEKPYCIIAYRLHNKAKPEFCESVMRSIPEPETKPTIEQLAADYRNAKDCAEHKQQEADAAKADAEAKLKALELAGEALGLNVSPLTAKKEPELVITDWSDLRVGDEVELAKLNGGGVDVGEIGVIRRIDIYSMSVDFPSQIGHLFSRPSTKWKFIRRP